MKKILQNIKNLKIIFNQMNVGVTVLWGAAIFISAILTPVVTWIYKLLIDRFSDNSIIFESVSIIILLYIAVELFQEIIENVQLYFASKMNYQLNDGITHCINKKISKIKLELYEKKITYDLISRVRENMTSDAISTFGNIFSLITLFITLLSYLAVVSLINIYLPVLIIISIIPYCVLLTLQSRRKYNTEVELSEKFRYVNYLNDVLTERESAKEVRTFKILDYIKNKAKEERKVIYLKEKKNIIKNFRETIFANILQYISLGLMLLWGFLKFKEGKMSIGDILLIIAAIQGIISCYESIVANFATMTEFSFNFHDWNIFMNLEEEQKGDDCINDFTIKLENVSFSYPDSETEVLHNINLVINPNEKIAIVGENGSGKSTLINLLLGLYQPTNGKITVGGVSLNNILTDYRMKTACLFQDYVKYQISIDENIFLEEDIEKDEIKKLRKEMSFIEKLPLKEKTILGKIEENSIELSGGQWQKLAIARALARKNTKILMLDEPTASLDPNSESKIYENLENISKNKTLLLISHRLGVARLCDKIIVLNKGNIIEHGNHEKLMEQQGEYYKMFNAQKELYGL